MPIHKQVAVVSRWRCSGAQTRRSELIPSGGEWSERGRSSDREGDSVWVDDFEAHWPNIEDVDDGRLVEIRKKTMEAIDDPILLSQQPFA